MKNKKKKAVSFLLASLMIAAAITGCSSVANGNGSVPESSAASSSDTAGSSESSESAPAAVSYTHLGKPFQNKIGGENTAAKPLFPQKISDALLVFLGDQPKIQRVEVGVDVYKRQQ